LSGKNELLESEKLCRLFFEDNKPLILRTLNYLDERLDSKVFFRANRKHIINLKWVDSIEPWLNGGLLVKLKDGHKVEVSRRQAVKFKDMLSSNYVIQRSTATWNLLVPNFLFLEKIKNSEVRAESKTDILIFLPASTLPPVTMG
jgi:hypothetical protein